MRTGSHTGRGVIQPAFKNAIDGCRMSRGGVYPHKRLNKQRMNIACDFNAPKGLHNLAHDLHAPRGAPWVFAPQMHCPEGLHRKEPAWHLHFEMRVLCNPAGVKGKNLWNPTPRVASCEAQD